MLSVMDVLETFNTTTSRSLFLTPTTTVEETNIVSVVTEETLSQVEATSEATETTTTVYRYYPPDWTEPPTFPYSSVACL